MPPSPTPLTQDDVKCSLCRRFHADLKLYQTELAAGPFFTFQRSASQGCVICALITKTAEFNIDRLRTTPRAEVHITVSSYVSSIEDELLLNGYEILKACAPEDVTLYKGIFCTALYTPIGSPLVPKHLPSLPHIPASPLSRESYLTVRSWLDACRQHRNCTSSADTAIPKRLLDVGDDDKIPIRLVSVIDSCKYLTLSHCWGDSRPLSTNMANMSRWMNEIPWNALPRSFQDAVRVTRWLGFRYLWIDSLCIIQDSQLDWEEESARMAQIYGSCELTIAASRAASCDEGFLQPRNEPRLVMSGRYRGNEVAVYSRDPSYHNNGMKRGSIPFPIHECPIFDRGWCFQERLLSPRTLHFSHKELFFQCRTEQWCECRGRVAWPEFSTSCDIYYAASVDTGRFRIGADSQEQVLQSIPEDKSDIASTAETTEETTLSWRAAVALLKRLYEPREESEDSEDSAETDDLGVPLKFGQLWSSIVSDYSNLNLSFPHDILPALSGISNLMAQFNPSRYFAGIWERDIHYLLAWESVRHKERCYRPSVYTAPSFSWASRIGPVLFPSECRITQVCTILDIGCDTSGQDPFGQVRGGYITLKCKMIRGKVHRDSGLSLRPAVLCHGVDDDEFLNPLYFDFDTEDDEAELGHGGLSDDVYCLELFTTTAWKEELIREEDSGARYALILKKKEGSEDFQRVGLGRFPTLEHLPDSVVTIV